MGEIEMAGRARRQFLKPKFLVPASIILWLVMAVPLALVINSAEAAPKGSAGTAASSGDCNQDPFKTLGFDGTTWNHGISNVGGFQLIDACHTTTGTLTFGDNYSDGDRDDYAMTGESGYSSYANALQWYGECRRGTDRECNMLGESAKEDRAAGLTPYCLDWDTATEKAYPSSTWRKSGYPAGAEVPPTPGRPCEAINPTGTAPRYQVTFQGAQVLDTKHWKTWMEIHPVIHETYKDSKGQIVANNTSTFKRQQ